MSGESFINTVDDDDLLLIKCGGCCVVDLPAKIEVTSFFPPLATSTRAN
jgi:hypothetical protein